jgi:cytochrome c oxidase subunit 4
MLDQHIVPVRVYVTVFASLLILLIVTVIVAFFDLGFLNVLAAMSIAVTKTVLIVLYFMHVRYSSRLTWVFAGAGILWLIILVAFTLSDFMTRGWFNPVAPSLGNPYDPLGGG